MINILTVYTIECRKLSPRVQKHQYKLIQTWNWLIPQIVSRSSPSSTDFGLKQA